ncbi:hypothetical protein BU14_0091s0020 [Porphyra umbilicalis]|uniref:Uncharacterized protein n=1 Tax=Porphyra umbilicalis TaxID=2786 RepID=A0A1X6PE10_PORUM|nr:hypothetical protein BU14_0091s0020 [Porphyra umbilicalis]|eukprot:OSX79040.1 hypothetical protein BU14_0091s0020 [Porphyra umbilicalis]
MRCLVCGFEAAPGVLGLKTRSCPLGKKQCRRLVATHNPFFLSGPCLNIYGSHMAQCDMCGLRGHTRFTLKLTTRRWRLSHQGAVVPCVAHSIPLVGDDFVCTLVPDRDAVLLVAAIHEKARDG